MVPATSRRQFLVRVAEAAALVAVGGCASETPPTPVPLQRGLTAISQDADITQAFSARYPAFAGALLSRDLRIPGLKPGQARVLLAVWAMAASKIDNHLAQNDKVSEYYGVFQLGIPKPASAQSRLKAVDLDMEVRDATAILARRHTCDPADLGEMNTFMHVSPATCITAFKAMHEAGLIKGSLVQAVNRTCASDSLTGLSF